MSLLSCTYAVMTGWLMRVRPLRTYAVRVQPKRLTSHARNWKQILPFTSSSEDGFTTPFWGQNMAWWASSEDMRFFDLRASCSVLSSKRYFGCSQPSSMSSASLYCLLPFTVKTNSAMSRTSWVIKGLSFTLTRPLKSPYQANHITVLSSDDYKSSMSLQI